MAAKKGVTIWLQPEMIERIDKLAVTAEISRSKLLENMVTTFTEEIERYDKIGLFRFSVVLRNMQEALRSRLICISENKSEQDDLAAGVVTPAG